MDLNFFKDFFALYGNLNYRNLLIILMLSVSDQEFSCRSIEWEWLG